MNVHHLAVGPALLRGSWIMTGLVAYYFSRRTLRRASRTLRDLRASGRNGRLLLVAKSNQAEERLRVLKSVTIVAVGLVSFLSPTPPGTKVTVASVTVTVGIFLIGAGIAAGAIMKERFYDRLDDYLSEDPLRIDRRRAPRS